MKKIYISPKILVTKVNVERMIAQSEYINKYDTGGSTQLVKENRSGRGISNYNVWDDDWSN